MLHLFTIEATAGDIADRVAKRKIIERAKIETVIKHAVKMFGPLETGQVDVHSFTAGESAHVFREAPSEALVIEIAERDGVLLDEPETTHVTSGEAL